ncbi:putative DmhB [Vibrio nigripulchritudo MADA3029]|uniref:NAD-dependent epimerase/dehydratase family protein n=1 Tax=Vibrio nigripulchritudo TaxID=28173 RepID=UPI0003B1E290|nr:NAD(P)-dependent oxidoreductase [Vibrio nigripulchritudo]CCN47624.1 putative DmhB [Vibrio nigripulchritudo MADA3020]CCN56553.1 putative DmhB [Vibrio nigripulchritudo MADA3021]CCN58823.1 putative DmhB [Vibrio nigripulchritudo MADA3029]
MTKPLKLNKIFILGSSGYIGTNLFQYLNVVTEKFDIVPVCRNVSSVCFDLESYQGNLLDFINEGDFILFLSAISSPTLCEKEPELCNKVNVENTVRLIDDISSKGGNVIFSSSDMVFGNSNQNVFDNSPLRPFGAYGNMKAEVEKYSKNYPNVKIVRFSYVVGKGDKYTSMLIDNAKKGLVTEVYEGFERSIVSLDDVQIGLYNLILNWRDIQEKEINFVGPQCLSRWEMTMQISQVLCPNLEFYLVEAPKGFWLSRPKSIYIYSNAFKKILGKEPDSICKIISNWDK